MSIAGSTFALKLWTASRQVFSTMTSGLNPISNIDCIDHNCSDGIAAPGRLGASDMQMKDLLFASLAFLTLIAVAVALVATD